MNAAEARLPLRLIDEAMSREDYDRLDRVNYSTLKHIEKSPANYRHAVATPSSDSPALKVGRAFHLHTFEPERVRSSLAVWDGGTRRGKEWDKFCAKNEGRDILTQMEDLTARSLASAVRGHPAAQKYIAGGKSEVTLLWAHSAPAVGGLAGYEVQMKARLDFIANCGAIVDVKSTRDASRAAFGRQAFNLGYITQAALYSDAYEFITGRRLPYVLIAVEKTLPHLVGVYQVTPEQIEAGRETYRAWLDRLAFCRSESKWAGYNDDAEVELQLPPWASGDLEDEDNDLSDTGLTFGDDDTEAA